MRYIVNESTDPYYNLALDEYVLNELFIEEDYFILWQNQPSLIIGKNQNTLAEINEAYVLAQGIKVARRITGGGTVYHDLGNLNFTFISRIKDLKQVNFKKYVEPIVQALRSMGVDAQLSGRNDILVDGKKVSGNAQRSAHGYLLHHGTLLFDVDIEVMVKALNVGDEKFISKAAKSVKSRVANIKAFLPKDVTLNAFWERLHYYLSNKGEDKEIILSTEQKEKISLNAQEKFGTWAFIYGASPPFNVHHKKRFDIGTVEVFIQVKDGTIANIRINGDYLGIYDIKDIEQAFIDIPYTRHDILKRLQSFELDYYFGHIMADELIDVLYQ